MPGYWSALGACRGTEVGRQGHSRDDASFHIPVLKTKKGGNLMARKRNAGKHARRAKTLKLSADVSSSSPARPPA